MATSNSKARQLAEAYGYEDPMDLLEETGMDGAQPGICMAVGCDYTTDVEPDQNRGYCEVCEKQTVASISILLGVI